METAKIPRTAIRVDHAPTLLTYIISKPQLII